MAGHPFSPRVDEKNAVEQGSAVSALRWSSEAACRPRRLRDRCIHHRSDSGGRQSDFMPIALAAEASESGMLVLPCVVAPIEAVWLSRARTSSARSGTASKAISRRTAIRSCSVRPDRRAERPRSSGLLESRRPPLIFVDAT